MARALAQHGTFFAAGLVGMVAQVLLLRELVVGVAGDELAIGVGLAAWLLGVATGARVARGRRRPQAPRDAAVGIALLTVLPVVGIVTGRVLRSAVGTDPGELPGLGLTLILATVTLVPPGATVGWTFTALASSASRHWGPSAGIARVYVAESLGALLGGLLVTVLVGRYLPPLPVAALVGLTGALLALAGTRDGRLEARLFLTAAAGLCAFLALASPRLDTWSERLRFAGIAPGIPLQAVRDTPRQHLALGGREGVWHLYASGQYAASFPDHWSAEVRGHLVACLAPRPERVLLMGGAERGLLRVVLQHAVRELVLVVPDREGFAFVRARLAGADRAALEDPRVRVVHDDPRRRLSRSEARYDLIVLGGSDPVTLLQARLATTEFYQLCAARLAPNGVLVAEVRTAPNVLVGETAALAGSLYGAMRQVLPIVHATPGPDALLVAGWNAEAVTVDPAVLAERWDRRGIATDSFGGVLLPTLLPPARVAEQEAALLDASARVTPSRDDRPASFLHALARRQSMTAGPGGRVFNVAIRMSAWTIALLALAPSLLALAWLWLSAASPERRIAFAASHAVAVTGAAGMGFSLLLLLSFQTRVGALYGTLGALAAVFMLGLALGATMAHRAVVSADVGREAASGLLLVLASTLVYAFALPWTLRAAVQASAPGLISALLAHGALLLAGGVVTGALFPVASAVRLQSGDDASAAAGRLESADHAGAGAAALVGAVLLIPRLGLARTAWLLAALLVLALVGVAVARRGSPERWK